MAEGYASRVERALLTIVFLVLWFLPLMIAGLYKLPHQGRIAVLSIALGWTGVAWLAALTIVIGGAIRATEPRPQGSRGWPDGLVRPQARAPDSAAQGPDNPTRPQVRAPDVATAAEPPQPPEPQPSFPPVRSPWPGQPQ